MFCTASIVRRIAARLCLGVAALAAALPAAAAPFSDLWYNRNESGWGMNVIDQQRTLFITLFVYGPDGRPTWYVASEVTYSSAAGRFSGPLYATTGPYFGGSFTGAVNVRQVGTITFTPNSAQTTASVSYSVDGVTVNKTVERQTWRSLSPAGTYFGAIDAAAGCTITGLGINPDAVIFTISLVGSTLNMAIGDAAAGTLSLTASVTQYGSVYFGQGTLRINSASFVAAISDFSIDDDGIAGNIAVLAPSGCTLQVRFSGLRPR